MVGTDDDPGAVPLAGLFHVAAEDPHGLVGQLQVLKITPDAGEARKREHAFGWIIDTGIVRSR